MKNDYYIGWNEKIPQRNKKALRLLLIPIFALLPIITFVLVYFENPFNDHTFELGMIREFQGIYFNQPKPIIVLDKDLVPTGFNPEALLVGYGKHGVESTMKEIQRQKGNLNGKKIQLRGTLLFGDGKIIIELTEGITSVIPSESDLTYSFQQTTSKSMVLKGEILDPKCWFGAMKPGEGKIHKSCAIRCISGGIPPVLKVQQNGKNIYYLLLSQGKEQLNKSILEFVAEPVEVSGKVLYQNGWNVIKTSPEKIKII